METESEKISTCAIVHLMPLSFAVVSSFWWFIYSAIYFYIFDFFFSIDISNKIKWVEKGDVFLAVIEQLLSSKV